MILYFFVDKCVCRLSSALNNMFLSKGQTPSGSLLVSLNRVISNSQITHLHICALDRHELMIADW
jgi:hypothetical protein